MSDHVDSVKEYARQMERWQKAAREKGDAAMVATYEKRIGFFRAIVEETEQLRRITKPIPASYGDLSDLPPELIKELSGIKVDDLEQQIYTIIKAGKEVDLDMVLIELFRRFEVIQNRKFLQNKLWRMAQKELIYSVPARKGVYCATKPLEDSPSENDPFGDYGSGVVNTQSPFGSDLDEDIPF